jgi:hypothetical protein
VCPTRGPTALSILIRKVNCTSRFHWTETHVHSKLLRSYT